MNHPQATIATAESQVSTSANGHYAPCQECGAPLDRDQRYCISCGARRGDAANPTSRYFAAAAGSPRASPERAARPAARRSWGFSCSCQWRLPRVFSSVAAG